MANSCYFNLKASSQSRENLKKFVEILTNQKDYTKPYIAGIYDVESIDFGDEVDEEYCLSQMADGSYETMWQGDCKWSVRGCMRNKVDVEEDMLQVVDDEKNICTLERLSKDLDLVIEYFSEEIGYAFAEHCIIDKGNVLVDDEIFYTELSRNVEDTWEEWQEQQSEYIDDIVKNEGLTLDDVKQAYNKAVEENLNYVTIGGYDYFEFET